VIATVTLNVAIDKRYVIENFKLGTVMRVKECNYTAGGKGLNVSRVAKLMGEDVTATGFIGGHAGEYVAEKLGQTGVKSNFIKIDDESRSCINFFDEASGKQTEFLEPGANVKPEDIDKFLTKLPSIIEGSNVVAISGSVPRGVDTGIYADIIKIVKDKGKKVILDTSGELLKKGIKACPTMIKPNTDEIKALLGVEIDNRAQLIDAAKQLHDSGIPVVVISLGKDGALIVCDDGVFQGITPDIKVVNTVGCGDSMVAAFAVGFSRNYSIEDTIKTAMAVSTANALRVETGYFLQEDYDRLIKQVEVKKL
jgi:tagatose 6-phosphate kinase